VYPGDYLPPPLLCFVAMLTIIGTLVSGILLTISELKFPAFLA
jgi:hypothetical protein